MHQSVYETNGNEISILDSRIDSVWHADITYAISIPNNPSFVDCCNLLGLLERNDRYTRENTIVFCTVNNLENLEEVAPGFAKCVMRTALSEAQKRAIVYYVIEKKKNGKFEYLMTQIE